MGSGHAAYVEIVSSGAARVVVSRQDIARRVRELAHEITCRYGEGELTIVAVLTGALVFLADLVRELSIPVRIETVTIGSYPGRATRSCGPEFRLDPQVDLWGRHVLVVDDILDTGLTLGMLMATFGEMGPASLGSCVMVRKDRPDLPDRMTADIVGFDVADEFVVGYGMDFAGLYRNWPDICVLSDHASPDGAS